MSLASNPRISVVMPVYNAEETLDPAIQSIINQTTDDFELIIVDDGSGDRSSEIIDRWHQQESRIHALHRKHQGIVPTLNAGLQKAHGQYIARMDADDRSLPQRLQKQARFLDEHPSVGLVSCLVKHDGDASQQQGYAHYVDWINSLTSYEEISLHRFIESPLAHPSVMFRRNLLEQCGGYRNGPFPEDYELWLRWLEQDVRMTKLPEVLLEWHDRSDRLSRTHPRYSTEAFYKTKAQYLARWLQNNNPRHPEVAIWGAGRSSRKRAELLTDHGIRITHYIDVDPNKIGEKMEGRPVISYQEIPQMNKSFIVSYVANRGVNQQISTHLNDLGYRLGTDFIFAA